MVRYIWGIEMIIKEIREIIKWVYNNLSCFQNGNDSEYYQGRKRGGAKNKGEKESEMISHEIFFLKDWKDREERKDMWERYMESWWPQFRQNNLVFSNDY